MSNASHSATDVKLRRPDLYYYDQLPPSARRALADSAFDWSAGAVLNRWKRGQRGFKSGSDIAERIAEWDQLQIDKDRKRVWKIT